MVEYWRYPWRRLRLASLGDKVSLSELIIQLLFVIGVDAVQKRQFQQNRLCAVQPPSHPDGLHNM